MDLKMQLVSAPYNEPGPRPDWPIMHCDGLMLSLTDGHIEDPPALIQLVSNGRINQPLPPWREGAVAILTPLASCQWNDVQETGRCYVDLYLRVACEDREGWLDGMIPCNPNLNDFSKDSTAKP